MAKPIKRVSLQSEIIKYIQSYIEEHDLKEGDRLPSQGQFIEMMQVSRTALREAVKTLEAEGIVEVKNGKGHICRRPREKDNGTRITDRFYDGKRVSHRGAGGQESDGDRADGHGREKCHRPGDG